jgi:hypothetical protein
MENTEEMGDHSACPMRKIGTSDFLNTKLSTSVACDVMKILIAAI